MGGLVKWGARLAAMPACVHWRMELCCARIHHAMAANSCERAVEMCRHGFDSKHAARIMMMVTRLPAAEAAMSRKKAHSE